MPKLGKLPARIDKRTIQFKLVLKKVLPAIPESFDVDRVFPGLSFPYGDAYGNDEVGDCVEVAKYMQMLRFEAREQSIVPQISAEDVKNQYFKETGGPDSGLVMINALNQWRQDGLRVGGRKLACLRWGGSIYKSHAYAKIDQTQRDEVKACISMLSGVSCGLMLPVTAGEQWDSGKPWDYVDGPGNEFGSWGGHGVYLMAYDKSYLQCFTWGKRQAMSWDFFLRYSDEDYGIIDERNDPGSPIDPDLLEGILAEITK